MKLEAYKNIKHFILDLLFPAACASCGSFGSSLCKTCASEIPLAEPACFVCNARRASGSICNSCRPRVPHLTRLWWAVNYDNAHIRNAITQFKYNGNRTLAETLATYILASVKKRAQAHHVHFPAHSVLLALPLHPQKKRSRGFNQSELLTDYLARHLGLPILPAYTLVRTRHTPPQAQAGGREKRKKNVEQVFAVRSENKSNIYAKTVILVDDIATTGSTLNDAARALKVAGAAHVWGLVVAKG